MRTLIPRISHKVVHIPSLASWCPFQRKKTEFEVLVVTVAELIAYMQQCSRSPCSIFPDIAAPAISEFDASEISELALEVGGLVAPTLESLPAPADPGCRLPQCGPQ